MAVRLLGIVGQFERREVGKLAGVDIERSAQLHEIRDAQGDVAAFDVADAGVLGSDHEPELLLRQSLDFADAPKVRSEVGRVFSHKGVLALHRLLFAEIAHASSVTRRIRRPVSTWIH